MLADDFWQLANFQDEDFELRMNPAAVYRGRDDRGNRVDARLISKATGVFIDIYSLSPHLEEPDRLTSKDSPYSVPVAQFGDPVRIQGGYGGVDGFYVPRDTDAFLKSMYGNGILTWQGLRGAKNCKKDTVYVFEGLQTWVKLDSGSERYLKSCHPKASSNALTVHPLFAAAALVFLW